MRRLLLIGAWQLAQTALLFVLLNAMFGGHAYINFASATLVNAVISFGVGLWYWSRT